MSEDKLQDITGMLREWSGGDQQGLERLLPVVYKELHRQAAAYLRREPPGPHAAGHGVNK